MNTLILAGIQQDTVGKRLLETSLQLNKLTVQSWDIVWDEVINPSKPLWFGLCKFGIILAAMGIIVVTFQMAWDFQERRLFFWDLPASLVWPLIIIIALSQGGNVLHIQVKAMRGIAYDQIDKILSFTVANVTFQQALADMTLTANAKSQIQAIYAECASKTASEYEKCIVEKQPIVADIVAQAEALNGGPLDALAAWLADVDAWLSDPGAALSATIAAFFIGLLWACQWAFVNILEATLLLTATLAPVFAGLSMLPLGKRPIWAWASTFLGVFSAQMGYTIIIGVAATVLVKAGAQSISDLAFLAFICIFAPMLAILIGGGGGMALFNGISSATTNLASGAIAPAGAAVLGGATRITQAIISRIF